MRLRLMLTLLAGLAAFMPMAPAWSVASATTASPVAWFEIPVMDVARAKRFYQALFGWRFSPFPTYGFDAWRIETGTPGLAGVFTAQTHTVKNNGIVLFMRVDDMETVLTRAIALGGSVEQARRTVSAAFGSTIVLRDPDKNAIGLVGPLPRRR